MVTNAGQWVVPCEMDGFYNCPEFIGWIIPFIKDGKWGFYTYDGIYVDPQFEEFTDEGDDIVSVRLNGQWGWLDEQGHFITKQEAEERDILPISWWLQDLPPFVE